MNVKVADIEKKIVPLQQNYEKKRMINKIVFVALMLLASVNSAAETPNEMQAKRIFNHAYDMVFGEQGSSLHYDVKIAGLFSTSGTIWSKGKKSKYISKRSCSWNDGNNVFVVRDKKKTVEIYSAQANNSDKYAEKFKFHPENFIYHIEEHQQGLLITLKAKKGAKGIKEIKTVVDRTTHVPKTISAKVLMLWAKIKVTNFKAGGIDDDIFVFPKDKFKGYKYTDKRKA
jgi:hypothetical protein